MNTMKTWIRQWTYISNDEISIFKNFFRKREILIEKINKQLVNANLLLRKKENVI